MMPFTSRPVLKSMHISRQFSTSSRAPPSDSNHGGFLFVRGDLRPVSSSFLWNQKSSKVSSGVEYQWGFAFQFLGEVMIFNHLLETEKLGIAQPLLRCVVFPSPRPRALSYLCLLSLFMVILRICLAHPKDPELRDFGFFGRLRGATIFNCVVAIVMVAHCFCRAVCVSVPLWDTTQPLSPR